MATSEVQTYKVAVVWRGDLVTRAEARPDNNRLKAIFEALARQGPAAEPAVFCEASAGDLREQLRGVDAVPVWVDPIATTTGERRTLLDDILRPVADTGVLVSTHPDVIAKMGVKAVLHRTRALGLGHGHRFYETPDAFLSEFPELVRAAGRSRASCRSQRS